MTKEIRLFKKEADGRLTEVKAADAAKLRASKRYSRASIEVEILFTTEEEAERDAEEAAEAKRIAEWEASNKAAAATPVDPTDKLRAFLAANPDVAAALET